MRYRFITPLLALALVAGCASAPANGNRPKRQTNVITAEEIQATTGLRTAYDAVQRLRPQFLQVRGRGTILGSEGVVVYMDGMPQGGIEFLRQINISQVKEIRYLNARDATTKYGTGVNQGVIEVVTR